MLTYTRFDPRCLLICLLFLTADVKHAKATSISWDIRPKTCVVESIGEPCEIELQIELHALPKGQYCYFQNDVLLNCWDSEIPQTRVVLRFNEPVTFALKDKNGKTVLVHSIDLKTRENSKRTRRVRQPWSLF